MRKKRERVFEADSERHTVCPEKGRNERIAVRAVKAADSPLFFQLRTAAANSAYSKLAYGNKAVWEITLETTGIFNYRPPPRPLILCFPLHSHSHHNPASTIIFPNHKRLSPVLPFDKIITFYSLLFLFCTSWPKRNNFTVPFHLGLSLSEEHSMYPLHFMQWRVQPDPPLSGCYYGDASRAKTKAEQKLSSLRQEPLADLWQPNLAWQRKRERVISLSLSPSVSLICTLKAFIHKQILTWRNKLTDTTNRNERKRINQRLVDGR